MAEIYDPAEDSWLLKKWVQQVIQPGMHVLDIGCGSGIQAVSAHEKGALTIGIDCNSHAIQHCKKKYPKKKFPKLTFMESDLFSRVSGTFDCIVCNPPYLPDADDAQDIKAYTTGGKHGYEFIEQLLQHAASFLKPEGCILLIFSTLTNKEKVDELISHYGFQAEQLEQQSFFYEKLFCYRITRTSILSLLNRNGIYQIAYLAKGNRGIVFSGKYAGKLCAVKTKNAKSKAPAALQREADMLKRVNAYGIGPRLYAAEATYVVMEYIAGMKLMDYLKKYPDKTLSIISLVLKQLYTLDMHNIEKKELVRPYKHIIIRRGKPVLLDFERATCSLRAHNVPQFLQFLTRMVYPSLRKDTHKLAQAYIKKPDIKPILSILKKI